MAASKSSLFTVAATSQLITPVKDPTSRININIAGYTLENYQKLHNEGYTILCETGKHCDMLHFFPNTKTVVLETSQMSQILKMPYEVIPGVAEKLQVSPATAYQKSLDFYDGAKFLVQPTGLRGTVYKTMLSIQNMAPVAYVYDAVTIARTAGVTGLKIVTSAPLTFVGATYLGGLVFSYFGAVAGNNSLGTICNVSSYILTRPMWTVETTLNGLIFTPISKVTGFPLVLNATNELMVGKGINITHYGDIASSIENVGTSATKLGKVYHFVKKLFSFGK